MSDFNIAYNKLIMYEGGWSNIPGDRGKETYKGISRVFHPDWPGWVIIDETRKTYPNDFKEKLNSNTKLESMVLDFYKTIFWNPFFLDEIKEQDIANELFEASVNMGISTVTKFLQKSLNLLNRDGSVYPDIPEDGKMGIGTKNTLLKCLSFKENEKYIFNLLNILQGWKYISIGSEQFLRGWLHRIEIKKN